MEFKAIPVGIEKFEQMVGKTNYYFRYFAALLSHVLYERYRKFLIFTIFKIGVMIRPCLNLLPLFSQLPIIRKGER